ncbi:MAG TPA: indole-3-glycerol phosphate synthase TrpC [Candidatus Dormibacteraeota bacterium]|nr:indole-3-glycerol phosphate synthase TrpC [Candidatus Dormibacteraeota bacterium]
MSVATGLLERLVAESTSEMESRRALVSDAELEDRAERYAPKDFARALRRTNLAVIAEMKQRTPSMGVLADAYRPEHLARVYSAGGAAALSVLTQEASFGGTLAHLEAARAASSLPILRKDFITDPRQVLEARAAGADAVLLIVAALPVEGLARLMDAAAARGLASLVEVHDEAEAVAAVDAGAYIIGVNHRDLRTFEVDLGLTERLRDLVPADRILVAESGIHGAADARRMRAAGVDAILVGELLMRSPDPAACIEDLAAVR